MLVNGLLTAGTGGSLVAQAVPGGAQASGNFFSAGLPSFSGVNTQTRAL